jgi:N-acetyl-1-D-myo-inositol-2-amino-2-deoxy-alpha-D-glucopyranoside deacetylase
MKRRTLLLGVSIVGAAGVALGLWERARTGPVAPPSAPSAVGRPVVPVLALPPHPRVIVFAPHPDDETVGAGGLITRLAHRHMPVRVVFFTNGDGYPRAVEEDFDLKKPTDADYVALGRLRQREALAAARQLGLAKRDVHFLGFPDGGLAELWRTHWKRGRPYTSPYTKEDSSPYPDTVNGDVDYDGQDLTSVVTRELQDFRPSVVIMPHPYEQHPDHVHTSYFVTEAVSALVDRGQLVPPPMILTYVVHYPSWPIVPGPYFDRLVSPREIADTRWVQTELAPAELAAKRAALTQYKSQLEVMGGFLRRFLCRNELFGRVDRHVLAQIASVH